MFDIDGTLTQTFSVDTECYVEAVREVAGFQSISTDWAGYPHTSDSGILDELYRSHLGRSPSEYESAAIKHRFVDLLSTAASKSANAFSAVPGARGFVNVLLDLNYAVSLATGGWEISARLKLAKARLGFENIPAAFADDALARCEIMTCSYKRACVVHAVNDFEEVTYFGDGSWDAIASKALGYRFIGVATGVQAACLTQMGAVEVIADYTDTHRVISALTL